MDGTNGAGIEPLEHFLPKWKKEVSAHYNPRLIMNGFRLEKDGKKLWCVHHKGINGAHPQTVKKKSVKYVFVSTDLYLWHRKCDTGGEFARVGPAHTAEERIAENESSGARIIQKIRDNIADPSLELTPDEKRDFFRFMNVMCFRSPDFFAYHQENHSDPEISKLAPHTRELICKQRIRLHLDISCCSAAVYSQSKMVEAICNFLQGRHDEYWRNCNFIVSEIEDPELFYITGSSPVCPIIMMPHEEKYLWLPITSKLAINISPSPHPSQKVLRAKTKTDEVNVINRFIYDASSRVIVQSCEHLRQIKSVKPTSIICDPSFPVLTFARYDSPCDARN